MIALKRRLFGQILMSARAKPDPVARLAAVQALYQMETAGAGVEAVVREFSDHRFGGDMEGSPLAEADEVFFGEIVRGVVKDQFAVDQAVARHLAARLAT